MDVTLNWNRDFADMIKSRILWQTECPRLSRWRQCNHKDSHKRNTGRLGRREGKLMMEAEIGVTQPQASNTATSRSWKSQGTDSPQEPPKGNNTSNSLILIL